MMADSTLCTAEYYFEYKITYFSPILQLSIQKVGKIFGNNKTKHYICT